MQINYGIIVWEKVSGDPVHFVGYEDVPTLYDFHGIRRELTADPEFGLIGCDLILRYAPPHVVSYFAKDIIANATHEN
jgi:hypothetical protein